MRSRACRRRELGNIHELSSSPAPAPAPGHVGRVVGGNRSLGLQPARAGVCAGVVGLVQGTQINLGGVSFKRGGLQKGGARKAGWAGASVQRRRPAGSVQSSIEHSALPVGTSCWCWWRTGGAGSASLAACVPHSPFNTRIWHTGPPLPLACTGWKSSSTDPEMVGRSGLLMKICRGRTAQC